MIRKRKSKIGDNEQEDGKNEEGEEAMEGLFLYNKKDSAIKSIEEVYENEEKNQNNESSTNKGITGNYNMDQMEDRIYHEDEEGSINNEYDDSVEARKLNTLQKLVMENNNTDEMKSKTIDELFDKYDKEIQSLIENFELLKFSQLFKNPFGPNISRDERIVRIFYYSGFSFLPYLGWVIASIYASFCKEKYKKNIVSIRIICSIQCALIGFIILLIIAIINWNNEQAMLCKYEGISFKKELIKDSKYNIVFFGPRSTDEWMGSVLAKISKDLNFNVYTISYPNLKNQIIKRKKNVFLKDAFSCARLKLSNVILFSFQIESALNFTIPFLEKNEILGFLSFSKKFPKKFDGLFGLGISDDKKKKQLIYDSIPKNILEKNMFAIYYPKNVDDDGAITFGGYDKKFIRENSSIEWFDVTSSKYWAIQMKGLKINDVFLDVCSKNHEGFCQAVIDTGTSSIAGPKEDLILLSRLLNPGKFCQKRILLKNFSFIFIDDKRREREYELTPKDYIVNSFRIDPVLRSPCNFAFMPINISSSNGYLYVLL
ncbi:hypothetical protein PFMC_05736 [Plasmodium falciparum CAMP/Malaysia]|uniref:Peptidase A1 domain-containing protein n=1 Tax=Plasmodium falciparum (isolate Camp / Malaysia) TaxID=5835 RepID=A0A024WZG2_PLAFC|nr:hypothetical protein PFMC_05736 [Plasmodium falciparum CAMP/Malaysia]